MLNATKKTLQISWIDKQQSKRFRKNREKTKSGNTRRFSQNKTKNISKWKTPGYDGIHGFWFKKFTTLNDRQVFKMNKCLKEAYLPEWITKEKTTLIQKDPSKNTPNNYRPITCLRLTWKILRGQKREEICYLVTSCELFPKEQKGCREESRGTGE